ncbi:MAG: 3'-5' exonuclease, partial [Prosthecobacter sp.]|nr:3'-5' exonuclease [Prosthecobacter sp.]
AIQVMTVHAAKGLEFDVVVLPRLDETAMNEVRHQDLLISRDAEGRVRWVLQTPLKAYSRLDCTLAAELLAAERRGAFESLCRLYVAMTRTKRGLYLIAEVPPKEAKALKESKLLRAVLGARQESNVMDSDLPAVVEWQTGARDWFATCREVPAAVPQPAAIHPPLGPLLRATQPMPRRRTPSGEETFRLLGKVLFSAGRETGRQLGTLVHALLAEVEFIGATVAELQQHWHSRGLLTTSTGIEAAAPQQVLHVLRSAECAAAFQPLTPHTQVWRERPFDLMLDGEWVSGIFDRVMMAQDAEGRITEAWIIDFKTDDVADAPALEAKVAGYEPQLALYRQTFARLTGLPETRIRTSLLFTRTAKLVEVG